MYLWKLCGLLYFIDFIQEFFHRFNIIYICLYIIFFDNSCEYRIAKLLRLMSQTVLVGSLLWLYSPHIKSCIYAHVNFVAVVMLSINSIVLVFELLKHVDKLSPQPKYACSDSSVRDLVLIYP